MPSRLDPSLTHQEALPRTAVIPGEETGSRWEGALGGSTWHSGYLPSLPSGQLRVGHSPPSIGPLVHIQFLVQFYPAVKSNFRVIKPLF